MKVEQETEVSDELVNSRFRELFKNNVDPNVPANEEALKSAYNDQFIDTVKAEENNFISPFLDPNPPDLNDVLKLYNMWKEYEISSTSEMVNNTTHDQFKEIFNVVFGNVIAYQDEDGTKDLETADFFQDLMSSIIPVFCTYVNVVKNAIISKLLEVIVIEIQKKSYTLAIVYHNYARNIIINSNDVNYRVLNWAQVQEKLPLEFSEIPARPEDWAYLMRDWFTWISDIEYKYRQAASSQSPR